MEEICRKCGAKLVKKDDGYKCPVCKAHYTVDNYIMCRCGEKLKKQRGGYQCLRCNSIYSTGRILIYDGQCGIGGTVIN